MTALARRDLFRVIGAVAVTSPLLLAQELSKHERAPIEPVQTGDILTAEWMNMLIERVNELGTVA